jgi:hypothetical protein
MGNTMSDSRGDITALLQRVRRGDASAEEQLLNLVYPDLRSLAHRCMHRERTGHTIQPTALLHETWLALVRGGEIDWRDRAHFFALCQLRLKIPQSTGRKFPYPRQVVVDGFSRLVEHRNRLVKRRWALVETNPPRNSWPQTHRDDERARGEAGSGLVPRTERFIGSIDLPMPRKTHAE